MPSRSSNRHRLRRARRVARWGWLGAAVATASCVHTTRITPGAPSPELEQAQEAVVDRVTVAETTAGDLLTLAGARLTLDSLTSVDGSVEEAVALRDLSWLRVSDRGRSMRDWSAIGSVVGGVIGAVAESSCATCSGGPVWIGLGAVSGAAYGLLIGVLFPSTLRFEIVPPE